MIDSEIKNLVRAVYTKSRIIFEEWVRTGRTYNPTTFETIGDIEFDYLSASREMIKHGLSLSE